MYPSRVAAYQRGANNATDFGVSGVFQEVGNHAIVHLEMLPLGVDISRTAAPLGSHGHIDQSVVGLVITEQEGAECRGNLSYANYQGAAIAKLRVGQVAL
jgi:hypothetical protein